ncbi:hypothetical protein [Peribacillus simplex]|nr:hypothetical protein [Peribacillus simplex]
MSGTKGFLIVSVPSFVAVGSCNKASFCKHDYVNDAPLYNYHNF